MTIDFIAIISFPTVITYVRRLFVLITNVYQSHKEYKIQPAALCCV